ncbi:MAG TPA: DUF2188 domain-containing protein [Capillimicrobium sp.]|nr:DUF2188 domain-containing protein [Capillimicrobium sp.]
MSSKRKPVHTVPYQGQWANRTEGAKRVFGVAPTKADAEARGRQTAQERRTEHISHRRDGTIGERRSYGRDPFPPRG